MRKRRVISKFLKKRAIFFFLLLGILISLSFLFWKTPGKENPSFLNFFDESQFLSSRENPVSGISGSLLVNQTFLKSSGPPFLVDSKVLGTLGEGSLEKEIQEYLVKEGEALSQIALKFGLSLETLLWANELNISSVIKPGQKLIILPVSGVLHIVKEGDTLSGLAQIYQASLKEIVEFNELPEEGKIYIGDILIVPGGKMPKVQPRYVEVPLAKTSFICPIPQPCRITQGLHWFNAVDFSNGRCGEPVFAVAAGEVQRTGYDKIAGYFIRILHPNGVVTFYGHLSKIITRTGEKVYPGQIIGYVGYSGFTIPSGPAGCHLHFDVRFAKNPFAF